VETGEKTGKDSKQGNRGPNRTQGQGNTAVHEINVQASE
jgi:hypothetical protein